MLPHAPGVGLGNVAFLLHYVWYTSGDEYIPLECFRHVLGLSCTFMSLPLEFVSAIECFRHVLTTILRLLLSLGQVST